MNTVTKQAIIDHLEKRANAIGFASIDRFNGAPEGHHPKHACEDARTVIVFGITVPRGMLRSPNYNLYFLHRTYHTVYVHLDEIGLDLCNFIEAQGDYLAVPIPSFAPLIYHGLEPWGIISLKHAAVQAGMAAFGRSGLVYHPEYGSLLRLGAVITSMRLPADPLIEGDPCPEKCNLCQKACPCQAFDAEGRFSKLTCLQHIAKHAIYPIALKDEIGFKNIERVINTAGYNYWLECHECLRVCPNNRGKC